MEKLSSKLGFYKGCLIHYCPACEDIHSIPVNTGNPKDWKIVEGSTVDLPGILPSVKLMSGDKIQCHYILERGLLNYCNDTIHKYTNQVIPLADIPEQYWQRTWN